MTERNNFENFEQNSAIDCDKIGHSIKKHLHDYMDEHDLTVRKLAEEANISISTLNSLLYTGSGDCKLSTAITVAKFLNISLDELVGADTINPVTMQNIIRCRSLPENSLYLVRWFIRHQEVLYLKPENKGRQILTVMDLLVTNDGVLKVTNKFRYIDISHLPLDVRNKAFMGISLGCDLHMPNYSPYDIILLANDRAPFEREHVIVAIQDSVFLAKQKMVNGKMEFYGIRDGKYRMNEDDVDQVIGYITGILPDPDK